MGAVGCTLRRDHCARKPKGSPLPEEPPGQEIEVEISSECEAGVYANFAAVNSGEHELTIDFCQIVRRPEPPDPIKARVVSRIRIAPTFVGPLLQAISENSLRREDLIRKSQGS